MTIKDIKDKKNQSYIEIGPDKTAIRTVSVNPDSLIYLPDSSNSAILYVGTAQYGTETTEAKWKIQRIDNTTGVVITNASTNFDQVWDDREILSYV